MPRISTILFTLLAIFATLGPIVSRARMDRIQLDRSEAHARAEAVERQALQAQLRLLQAQIEPHMLFNTLAKLQGLIAIDPPRAGQMLDQLIQYLRATLSVSRDETTTLEQEFAALEAYLGLMQVRMGARLSCRCHLPDELRAARLPAMLLQPLVENAIVHGLEPEVEGGAVTLEAARHGELLEIGVRDTGLGQTGTEAAEELSERREDAKPLPEVVFVTACDDYALTAFEQAAADYVLKPVRDERLRKTVGRLQVRLDARLDSRQDEGGLSQLVEQMRALLPQNQPQERLTAVRAAVGNVVRMIPVQDAVYFLALDKYVNVATADSEALIRLPLKDLLAQLDPAQFCQLSRSSIVNMQHVASASRDKMGKLTLALHGRTDRLKVSPLFAHLFRQMQERRS